MQIIRRPIRWFRRIIGIPNVIHALIREVGSLRADLTAHETRQLDSLRKHLDEKTTDLRSQFSSQFVDLNARLGFCVTTAGEVAGATSAPAADTTKTQPLLETGETHRDSLGPYLKDNPATHRLRRSILLNTVPKSGTVVAAQVMRAFIAPEDWLITPWASTATLDQLWHVSNKHIVGHLLVTPESCLWARDKRQVLLLRDPLENFVSFARFLCSHDMAERGGLGAFIRAHRLTPSYALRMVVLGWSLDGSGHPGTPYEYSHIAAWAGLGAKVIFFDDVLKAVKSLDEPYWRELTSFLGLPMPDDWRRRISDAACPERSQSWSAGLEYVVDVKGFPSEDDLAFLRAACGDLQEHYQTLREQFRSDAARALDTQLPELATRQAA